MTSTARPAGSRFQPRTTARLTNHATAKVRVFRLRPAGVPQGMLALMAGQLPRRGKTVRRILPDDLKQPETGLVAGRLHGNQRLVHQPCHHHGDRFRQPARTHLFSRVEGEPPSEYRQPAEHRTLIVRQKVMAPIQRRSQGSLPVRHAVDPSSQRGQHVIQPVGQLRGCQMRDPGSGQLERQRYAVEAETDACDRQGSRRVEPERW